MSEVFSRTALQRQIDTVMGGLPPGHGYAKVKVTTPDGTVSVVMAARVGEHWMLRGDAHLTLPTKDWGASVEVMASW